MGLCLGQRFPGWARGWLYAATVWPPGAAPAPYLERLLRAGVGEQISQDIGRAALGETAFRHPAPHHLASRNGVEVAMAAAERSPGLPPAAVDPTQDGMGLGCGHPVTASILLLTE